MTPTSLAAAGPTVPLGWLALERLTPFEAYAQVAGAMLLITALLQWLCSRYADARALRVYALLYLLTGIGWLVAHPRAHGGAGEVPLAPVWVAAVLLGLNVWALQEFVGPARVRAGALAGVVLGVGVLLTLWVLRGWPEPALAVYASMAAAFAYCAWRAVQAARGEGNVGHLYVAAAYATYPLMFALYLALPSLLAGFDMGYYAAVPSLVVGMTVIAVSLIRARQRTEVELGRRIAAEDSLRHLNATLEDRVATRTRELHELVAGLESFNRSVSHDLRDPLAGLNGLAQMGLLALRRGDGERAASHLQTIQAQAAQLADMVQDLLRLSRAADAPLQRAPQPLRRCVDDALAQLRERAPLHEVMRRLRVDVAELPVCAVDADLMRQAFVNLLGNALKFTALRGAAGRITVDHRDTARGPALCVEDNGLGLPHGYEAGLFKPFSRLHGERVDGSGVGLTIVRRVVEAHGGQIWAEPAASGGARFLFTLEGLPPAAR